MEENKEQFIFIDESGKPEVYSARGINLVEKNQATKYLVLAAMRTGDQLEIQRKTNDFKSELLYNENLKNIFSSAYTLDSFHAHNDYSIVREKFYEFIITLDIKVNVIVIDKMNCYPTLKNNPGKMYGVMAGQLLKTICHQTEKTEIIFSRKDSKLKLRQELEFETERIRLSYLENHKNLESEFKITYQHNPHYTHAGLQIADYIAYAVFQVFENKKDLYYKIIQGKIGRVWDICNQKNFTRNNPLQLSS